MRFPMKWYRKKDDGIDMCAKDFRTAGSTSLESLGFRCENNLFASQIPHSKTQTRSKTICEDRDDRSDSCTGRVMPGTIVYVFVSVG